MSSARAAGNESLCEVFNNKVQPTVVLTASQPHFQHTGSQRICLHKGGVGPSVSRILSHKHFKPGNIFIKIILLLSKTGCMVFGKSGKK